MKIDLTAITTPFGLLDPEMQETLKAHGGPYEVWNRGSRSLRWGAAGLCTWRDDVIYRVKPAPAQAWQPIETAPESNGSKPFLVHIPGHGQAVAVRIGDRIYSNTSPRRHLPMAKKWQPLPAPPSEEQQ